VNAGGIGVFGAGDSGVVGCGAFFNDADEVVGAVNSIFHKRDTGFGIEQGDDARGGVGIGASQTAFAEFRSAKPAGDDDDGVGEIGAAEGV